MYPPELLLSLSNEFTYFYFIVEKPPSFACHRTTPHTREGIITYSSCNIQNNGMNARTGKFTVQVSISQHHVQKKK